MFKSLLRQVIGSQITERMNSTGQAGQSGLGSLLNGETTAATDEAIGATLVLEGAVGIENPLSNRERGGLYSALISLLAAIGLFIWAPLLGAVFTGAEGDIRTQATVVSVEERITVEEPRPEDRNQQRVERTTYFPVLEFIDEQTGSQYSFVSSLGSNQRPSIGDQIDVAYAPDNPSDAIQIGRFGHLVQPAVRGAAAIIGLIALVTIALRTVALALGFRMMRKARAERRRNGDTRSTLETLRQGVDSHVSNRAVGALILAHSIFGLERPFDSENTRLGIVGTAFVGLGLAAFIPIGLFIGTQLGYVGDNPTSAGRVVDVVAGDSVIEYMDSNGNAWQLQDDTAREIGNQVLITYDTDQPDRAFVVKRQAAALRWFFIGIGVLGILGTVPRFLFQLGGAALGIAMIVRPRAS